MRPDAPVQWHETIDSTNEEARRLAQSGHYGPIWIASQQQTAGRGRLGRQWQSPPGNLYCSALFLEPDGIRVATRYPFAAGLAIADVCNAIIGDVDLRLKWPNDVRVNGEKLCGILVEAGTSSDGACWVVAGMGLNVAWSPDSLDQPATDLKALGAASVVDAAFVLDELRSAFA
ncbi:MAG: biotin--[acetyl-CoA-carboxylase] ligase, partial [Henriciella sp.]|uniref:biotin--[acetyl-CoA-carboxylase] ligase n=1 Tax=Henriciella sp. TaxID=1968823 RepID=UPI003C75C89C